MKEWIVNALMGFLLGGAGLGLLYMVLKPLAAKAGEAFEKWAETIPQADPIAELADDIIDKGFAYLMTHYADKDWVKLIDTADKLYDIFATEAGLRDDLAILEAKAGSKDKALVELRKRSSEGLIWNIGDYQFQGDKTIHTL